MIDKNRVATLFSTLVILFSSDIAMAVEKTSSSSKMSFWPLIALFVLLVLFRKKLFNEASPQDYEADQHETPKAKAVTPEKVATKVEAAVKPKAKETVKPATKPKPAAKPKVAEKPKAKSSNVDLRDGKNQCQGSTAKGSRCKRTTTLKDTSVTIAGTTYELTACTQHNNAALKPFADLIK